MVNNINSLLTELFFVIYENYDGPIIVLNHDFDIAHINDNTMKLFRFNDKKTIEGGSIGNILGEVNKKKLGELLKGRDKILDFEFIYKFSDEDQIYITTNIYKAAIEGMTFYALIMEDITDEIKREMDLHAVTIALEDAKNEVIKSREQLVYQEKLVSIGMLAAGIAHEINNPLGFVKSNFETLVSYFNTLSDAVNKIETFSSTDSEIAAFIAKIRKSGKLDFIINDVHDLQKDCEDGFNRIINIINALKNFSRQEMDKKDIFSLTDIINEALTITQNKTKHIAKITKELKEDIEIPCSKTEIVQVLINIIVNAAQALEENNKDDKLIIIRLHEEELYAVVEISDNGPGMPEDVRKKAFDPFFTTKPIGKGTGLGLYISYDIIVNKHGGIIDFISNDGEGTTFYIKIPKSDQQKKRKILIVDDDSSSAGILSNNLVLERGYLTEVSTNGFDAGVLMHTFNPDVVLLNYNMSGVNGYDVAKKIKQDVKTKEVKTIVYSDSFDEEMIMNLKDLGVDYILHKPYEISDLISAIESLFEADNSY